LTTKNDNIYTCIINFLRSVHNSKFENEIFSFLFNTTNSDNDMIRFRCCHLLNILFQEIDNEDEEFEEIFFDELIKSLRPRLRDITSNTQIEAISTLYRLQDWGDDCKIIKDFLYIMQFDPNWMVRCHAIKLIRINDITIDKIINCVHDKNPDVRYHLIEKFIKFDNYQLIKINEQRIKLLKYGFNDENENVVKMCRKMLGSWFDFYKKNTFNLLNALNVVDDNNTMNIVLDNLFADHSCEKLYEEFTLILNHK
jgi:hypothetical protein